MKNHNNIGSLDALHKDLLVMLENKKLNIKSALYLSCLDVDAEQLWVLRFYKEHSILPKIKQAKEIKETYDSKKLTLTSLHVVMETSLQPKKLVLIMRILHRFSHVILHHKRLRKIFSVYWKIGKTVNCRHLNGCL